MNGNSILHQVLRKYGLRWPVPPDVRERLPRAKKETLIRILSERGRVSITSRAVISLYRSVRGMGFDVTFRQGRMIASSLAAIVACALFTGIFFTAKPVFFPEYPVQGAVIFTMGEVNMIKADGSSSALKVRDLLDRGDTIKTGEKSIAVVQFGGDVLFRLQPASEVSVSSLIDRKEIILTFASGIILSKLQKLSKNKSFSVKTPSMIAAVRGTVFGISCGDSCTVAVTEGTVALKHLKTGDEPHLKQGNAADTGDALQERPVTEIEKIEMKRISLIPLMKNPYTATDAELQAMADLIRKVDSEVDAELQKYRSESIPQTLQEIRLRYGRIDVVTLYSGEKVRGVILVRGATMKLAVPGGYRYIPMNKVKNTSAE